MISCCFNWDTCVYICMYVLVYIYVFVCVCVDAERQCSTNDHELQNTATIQQQAIELAHKSLDTVPRSK